MISALDKIKLVVAALLVAAGVAGFYILSDSALVLRIVAILVAMGLAAAVAAYTEPGRQLAGFARESITETKKVVWPTRKETTQTTAVVFALVVLMAIFMWVVDAGLAWSVKQMMGWGS
ncbi:MAG: preprotein translocase subunit SecE [Burkholderiales bacterium]